MVNKISLYVILLFFYCQSYFSQKVVAPIMTDRPGLGESSQIVPEGFFNIETGLNLEIDKANGFQNYNMSWNNLTLRWGVFEEFEIRFAVNANQNFTKNGNQTARTRVGLTPWSLGFKARVSQQKGIIPRTARLGNLAIPFGASSFFKTTYVAPSMLIPMEWDLNKVVLLTVNTGAFWNGEDGIPEYFSSLGFDFNLPKSTVVFTEAYMNMTNQDDFAPAFNVGIVKRVTPNLQFDVSAGIGLNEIAADGFVNAGVSYRISK
jgi:hypothetical protein